MTPAQHAKFRARFWEKVNRNGRAVRAELGPCWEWTASLDGNGYGQFRDEPKTLRAHRVAWFLLHGRWPEKNCLHKCDNRACVNPDHLYEGSLGQNATDMYLRKRRSMKLTAEQVRIIRASGNSDRAAARCFGVSWGLISHVRLRKIWRHVA